MHLLIRARSGGLIIKTDANGFCAMDLCESEGERFLPLCGESMRRGMLSYILGEVRRVHVKHSEPPLFEDPMREAMLSRMKCRTVREPFCHTVFGQYSTKVLPSKIRIDDFGWQYANKLIAHLRPALTKITGAESLGDVNAALQDALSVSGAKQRRFHVALKKKSEGKELKEADLLALRYKDELEAAEPEVDHFDATSRIESKFLEYFGQAAGFVHNGFSGRKIPVSIMHYELLGEIHRLCGDPAWRARLNDVKSTKFSIIPYPQHTGQWVDIPPERALYVRGAPMTFATADFDLLVEDLTEEEEARVRSGPMSCFYGKWGTGFVSLEYSLPRGDFDASFPVLSEASLKAAGVDFLKLKPKESGEEER